MDAPQSPGVDAAARRRMVASQLRSRDIHDARVLDAMMTVPRHVFVPDEERARAYDDIPLPIGYGQTISQPYIVAFMTQALAVEPGQTVLEVGTGCGYQAAVLSRLVRQVYSLEIVGPLAARARETLTRLGYTNVEVAEGNGYLGWPAHAPFDRIIVTAAPTEVPPALVAQLTVGGILAIPVGASPVGGGHGGGDQVLRILRKHADGLETLTTLPVRFVPMTGAPT